MNDPKQQMLYSSGSVFVNPLNGKIYEFSLTHQSKLCVAQSGFFYFTCICRQS